MQVPNGMTEPEVISCIEYISNTLAPQFRFGYYDLDDLKQECRYYCLEALPKYDTGRGKLSTFLMTVAKRKFINLRRDKLYRMPPTCSCSSCMSGVPCSEIEKKMKKWRKLNTAKRDIMEANNLGDYSYDTHDDYELEQIIDDRELDELINEYLPVDMREDYKRLLEGIVLNKVRRTEIVVTIRKLLEEVNYERHAK